MPGLLADVNLQGHLSRIDSAFRAIGVRNLLAEAGIRLETFADRGLDPGIDDRTLWRHCQANWLVLTTNDKNNTGPNSLQATLDALWRPDHLPVITLANQGRFVRDKGYASKVASDIADILFDLATGGSCDRSRVFVPLAS